MEKAKKNGHIAKRTMATALAVMTLAGSAAALNVSVDNSPLSLSVSAAASKISNSSSVSPSTGVQPGAVVTLTGRASGGSGNFTFMFYRQDANGTLDNNDGLKWKTISKSTDNTAKYTFPESTADGNYNFKVVAKDSSGTTSSKILKVSVQKRYNTLMCNVRAEKSSLKVGESTNLTITPKGGKPNYKIEVSLKKPSDSAYSVIKTYTNKDAADIVYKTGVFKEIGTYAYRIKITDSQKKAATASRDISIRVADNKSALSNITTLSASSLKPFQSLKATVKSKGGHPKFTYDAYYIDLNKKENHKDGNLNKEILEDKYISFGHSGGVSATVVDGKETEDGVAKTYTFVPTEESKYRIKTVVTDSTGAVKVYTRDITVAFANLTNASSINIGGSISPSSVKDEKKGTVILFGKNSLEQNVGGRYYTVEGKANGGSGEYSYKYAFGLNATGKKDKNGNPLFKETHVLTVDKNGNKSVKVLDTNGNVKTGATCIIKTNNNGNEIKTISGVKIDKHQPYCVISSVYNNCQMTVTVKDEQTGKTVGRYKQFTVAWPDVTNSSVAMDSSIVPLLKNAIIIGKGKSESSSNTGNANITISGSGGDNDLEYSAKIYPLTENKEPVKYKTYNGKETSLQMAVMTAKEDKFGGVVKKDQSYTWAYSYSGFFFDLPKYNANGAKITYTKNNAGVITGVSNLTYKAGSNNKIVTYKKSATETGVHELTEAQSYNLKTKDVMKYLSDSHTTFPYYKVVTTVKDKVSGKYENKSFIVKADYERLSNTSTLTAFYGSPSVYLTINDPNSQKDSTVNSSYKKSINLTTSATGGHSNWDGSYQDPAVDVYYVNPKTGDEEKVDGPNHKNANIDNAAGRVSSNKKYFVLNKAGTYKVVVTYKDRDGNTSEKVMNITLSYPSLSNMSVAIGSVGSRNLPVNPKRYIVLDPYITVLQKQKQTWNTTTGNYVTNSTVYSNNNDSLNSDHRNDSSYWKGSITALGNVKPITPVDNSSRLKEADRYFRVRTTGGSNAKSNLKITYELEKPDGTKIKATKDSYHATTASGDVSGDNNGKFNYSRSKTDLELYRYEVDVNSTNKTRNLITAYAEPGVLYYKIPDDKKAVGTYRLKITVEDKKSGQTAVSTQTFNVDYPAITLNLNKVKYQNSANGFQMKFEKKAVAGSSGKKKYTVSVKYGDATKTTPLSTLGSGEVTENGTLTIKHGKLTAGVKYRFAVTITDKYTEKRVVKTFSTQNGIKEDNKWYP